MRMQVAGAAAVVAITALKLTDINVQRQGLNVTSNVQCLLGSSDQVGNLCYYAYAVAGFSLLASVALSLVQCITCNLCGCGRLLDTAFAGVGTAWWIAAALVFTKYGQASPQDLPNVNWRNSIYIISWAEVGLFGLMLLTCLATLLARCFGCCRDDRDGSKFV
eukprot:jgi/Chrzof1/2094/Cz11g02160.t1